MELNLSNITETFKKFSKKEPSFKKKEEMRAFKDWEMVCAGMLVFGIAISAGSAYLFYRVSHGQFFSGATEGHSPVETLSRKKLTEVIQKFEQEQVLFEQLKTKQPDIAVP